MLFFYDFQEFNKLRGLYKMQNKQLEQLDNSTGYKKIDTLNVQYVPHLKGGVLF